VAAPPEAVEEAEATRGDGVGAAPGHGRGAEHGRVSAGERLGHTLTNLLGAAVVLLFAWVSVRFFLHTHRLIGAVFFVQQLWVAAAFLTRRLPRTVSHRPLDWVVAFGGSFGGYLLRPAGLHPAWGLRAGLALQILGLALWALAFRALGRSFGLLPADRGLVTRGPYALVRHPLYSCYMVTQLGYLFQSISLWNGAVLAVGWTCQVIRAVAEERLFLSVAAYDEYRRRVRWRLIPGIW
jgi:protein-S-isoprenylcysteine O-methyltransferase Ste14